IELKQLQKECVEKNSDCASPHIYRRPQDKAQPETQDRSFGSVGFNALLALEDPQAQALVRQPGSDGFRVDSSPLFQVATGRAWYLHTIYTVRSRDNANRGIGKRSLEYHSLAQAASSSSRASRSMRSAGGVQDIADKIGAENNRGTNIMHIALDYSRQRTSAGGEIFADGVVPQELARHGKEAGLVTTVGVLVGLLLFILVVILLILFVYSKKKEKKAAPKVCGSKEPIITQGFSAADSSEV
uniref:Uncharacterized protein n=1 Tax=Paramormyrops kingsleyae TaxID=1676925 RepID=A0A3B3S0X1_9TELE